MFSLIAMVTYSATIVVARYRADVSMAPATCLSQVLVFLMFAPFAHVTQMGGTNLGYLALLGVVQMGMALFFLSLGARLVPAADAALISQLENVLGPLWVWLAGIEHPSAPTIAGGVIVIGAVALQITQGSRSAVKPQPAADELVGDFGGQRNSAGLATLPAQWIARHPGTAVFYALVRRTCRVCGSGHCVEALHSAETKHVLCVLFFHVPQSFQSLTKKRAAQARFTEFGWDRLPRSGRVTRPNSVYLCEEALSCQARRRQPPACL